MQKNVIDVRGEKFIIYMTEMEIAERVKAVAKQISNDFKAKKPLVMIILKGAFMFASDLLKQIDFPCEVAFVQLTSYILSSRMEMIPSGKVSEVLPIKDSIKGRNILVIEDIVETGTTIRYLLRRLKKMKAKEIKVASFIVKSLFKRNGIEIDYFVKEVSDDLVIGFGYGIDYNQIGRNWPCLYIKQ